MNVIKSIANKKFLYISAIIIACLGILLRIIFFLQNRCLFIDEANVARNIYERGFLELTKPLDYGQYAAPLFLWVIKCFTFLFGFSEFSLRVFPLFCGIMSIFLVFELLRRYMDYTSLWYPLMIIATGFIYIRYSAELKQYSCDMMVALFLILQALRLNIFVAKKVRFIFSWLFFGSIAIWSSMPSIFILTGVGVYYGYLTSRSKDYTSLSIIIITCIGWLLQFLLYYLMILKPQINSDYLQNWHRDFFLFPFPNTWSKLTHNLVVLDGVLSGMGGKWILSICFNLLTISYGTIYLLKEKKEHALLLLVPLLCLFLAAAFHQYALTNRLILFIMPLLLILSGMGLQQLFKTRNTIAKISFTIIAFICIFNFGAFMLFNSHISVEQITENMQFIKQENITAENLFVHDVAAPAFIYYTTIHPDRGKWRSIANAHLIEWDSNYDSLARTFKVNNALLYSYITEEELSNHCKTMEKYCNRIASHTVKGGCAFIYKLK